MKFALILLALAAASCRQVPPQDPPDESNGPSPEAGPAESADPAPAALPAGFVVKGAPRIEVLPLPPAAMWRFLVSRLTTLRADARAGGADLLVTFAEDVVHVTNRTGGRQTWRLPAGLRLAGGPAHILLGADLSTRVYDAQGTQAAEAEEITVVTARVAGAEGSAQEYRLVIKGGHAFRSISTTG